MTSLQRSRFRRWLPWFLTPVLIIICWQWGSTTWINVGTAADEDVIQGFHEREHTPSDTYRWTQPKALVRLPARDVPGLIDIRGTTAPDGTRVRIEFDTGVSVELPQTPPTPPDQLVLRRYRIVWPGTTGVDGWARLSIHSSTPERRVEERQIGLLITDIRLKSLPQIPRFPPLGPLLLLSLLPPALALIARFIHLPHPTSRLIGLAIGSLVVFLWAWRPVWVQPFLLHWLVAVSILAGIIWWARRVVAAGLSITAPRMLALLAAFGGLIPLSSILRYTLAYGQYRQAALCLALVTALAVPFVRTRARWLLIAIITVGVFGYAGVAYYDVFARDYADDFKALFRGPRSFLNGDPLYNLDQLRTNHLASTYKYPPFFVLLMGPLTGLAFTPAIQLWRSINLALLLLSAFLLWRWGERPLRSWSTLGLVYLLLVFQPLTDTLRYGQVDLIILVGLAAGLLMLGRGRWAAWGAFLALPTAIKIYPAYLLIHGAALRRWRSLAAFAGASAALLILSIVVLGLDIHRMYFFEVFSTIGGGTSWVENQTINGFLNRLVTPGFVIFQPDTPGFIRICAYLAGGLVSLITFMRVQKMQPDAGFGLWIVALLLVLPAAWIHYQAILLIPLYQLLVRIERSPGALSWRVLLLYCLAWALLASGNQWTFFDKTLHGPIWALFLSYKFYGLLLLWLALLFDATARTTTVAQFAHVSEPSSLEPAFAMPIHHDYSKS